MLHTECVDPQAPYQSPQPPQVVAIDRIYGLTAEQVEAPATDDPPQGMKKLTGGEFIMGTDSDIGYAEDGEGPARTITLKPFYIDITPVTKRDFAARQSHQLCHRRKNLVVVCLS